ncbi:hypothetical protein BGW38_005982 [Lunasporangiospora selenospora]|uniref:Uncharacterized protein n=1 Tax=Lunasporangiospora selenospora TaxID=979761 RepID=A0A9P6FN61_9FUNG|nr:hypothetical protein BGW38_005982 [Lunasporangiospora selenospora]
MTSSQSDLPSPLMATSQPVLVDSGRTMEDSALAATPAVPDETQKKPDATTIVDAAVPAPVSIPTAAPVSVSTPASPASPASPLTLLSPTQGNKQLEIKPLPDKPQSGTLTPIQDASVAPAISAESAAIPITAADVATPSTAAAAVASTVVPVVIPTATDVKSTPVSDPVPVVDTTAPPTELNNVMPATPVKTLDPTLISQQISNAMAEHQFDFQITDINDDGSSDERSVAEGGYVTDGRDSMEVDGQLSNEQYEESQQEQISVFEENHRLQSQVMRLSARIGEQDHQLADLQYYRETVAFEQQRAHYAFDDLHRQLVETKEKLDRREKDYEVMSKNYFEHIRIIRATDDDHSTISDKMSMLKAHIEHLVRKAQGTRSANLNKQIVIDHFKGSDKFAKFPIAEENLEPYHLNLYMESVVMSTLVTRFFSQPLNSAFDYNTGFAEIYNWMNERNSKVAVRWRQQLCVMIVKDESLKARKEDEINKAANEISDLISQVYTNVNEKAKIHDICTKAFELSIAMTGLETAIVPEDVALGEPFDEDTMATSQKSNPEGNVSLVVFPTFREKNGPFSIRPKVWCH